MAKPNRSRLFGSFWQVVGVVVCAALGLALFAFVDLTPKLSADFFFSTDDPQLQSSLRIENEFGSADQVFIAARAPQLASGTYLKRLHELTVDLAEIEGVANVRSLTHGPNEPEEILEDKPAEVFEDLVKSPFWSRLLLAPDRSATFLVLRLKGSEHQMTVSQIDRALERHARCGRLPLC
jgi:predicted RND superfamily exporter protein